MDNKRIEELEDKVRELNSDFGIVKAHMEMITTFIKTLTKEKSKPSKEDEEYLFSGLDEKEKPANSADLTKNEKCEGVLSKIRDRISTSPVDEFLNSEMEVAFEDYVVSRAIEHITGDEIKLLSEMECLNAGIKEVVKQYIEYKRNQERR